MQAGYVRFAAAALCAAAVVSASTSSFAQSDPVRDALRQAATFGERSLVASVVENVRLTPGRAGQIEAAAVALRPDLAPSIARAVGAGQALRASYSSGSGAAGADAQARSAPRATRYPGGDPSIPIRSLSEYQRNYSLDAMHADAALAAGFTGKGVVVGVLDSGIDQLPDGSVHPEFTGRVDPRATSFLYFFDAQRYGPNWTEAELEDAFNQRPTDSEDQNSHGTHVAGIIGAGRNGFGMQGVAPEATILPIKIVPQNGVIHDTDGDSTSIVNLEYCGPSLLKGGCDPIGGFERPSTYGLRYLAQFPDVRVINGSFGPGAEAGAKTWDLGSLEEQKATFAEAEAVRRNLDAGQIVVMSASNDRIDAPILAESPTGIGLYPFIQPANAGATNSAGALIYDDHGSGIDLSFTSANALAAAEEADGKPRGRIVVVVALDAYNELASYSNMCGVAMEWCVAAPGGDEPALFIPNLGQPGDRGILSTVPRNNYGFKSGTSMAAPNVAGAIAVLIEAYPSFTPAEIVYILFTTAEDLGAPGVDPVYGWGLVRLDRALSAGPVGMTGTGVYVVAGGDERIWSFDFSSGGGLQMQGPGGLVIASNATFQMGSSVTGGALTVDGLLTTPSLLVGADGTLGGTGGITADVTVAGNLSPGNSPGTLTVTGNLALTSTATTTIEIDGTGTGNGAGNYDRVILEGAGSVFTAAGTLAPVLRGISGSATNTFVPGLGEEFAFVQVPDGTVAGSFSSLTQPSDGLPASTRFDVLYYPSVLTLAATPASYANLATLGIGQSGNEAALGAAIDAARPAAGVRPATADNDLFNTLYTASEADLVAGFSSLTGQVHAEIGTTAVRSIGRFADTLGERQIGLAANWLSAGETPYGTGQVWAQGETVASDVGSSGGLAGYDVRATSGAFGLDWRLGAGAVGIAGSYEYADLSADQNGSGDVASYHGGIYGTFDTGPVMLALRGGLTYADLSTGRVTSLGAYSATANADGRGFGGFAEVSAFQAFETPYVTITPSATLGYRGFNRDDMDETGSLFALSVPGDTFDETQATLAVALSRRFHLANGMVVEPVASLGWRHDFGEITRASRLGLLNETYTVGGADVGADALLGRLDLTALSGDRFALGASYQAELRDNLTSHVFSAEASFRF